jgi:hypothetical protein
MGLYRRGPAPADPKKDRRIWHFEFIFAGRRIRGSTKTYRVSLAEDVEKNKRLELERAYAGIPADKPEARIDRVADRIKLYLKHYPSNHRAKSVIFVTQRLKHVQRLLGSVLLMDLTEGTIRDYIKTRLTENAGGRTINMEVGELSRAIGQQVVCLWPKVRKLEENHDVGRALSPEKKSALLSAAAHDDVPRTATRRCIRSCRSRSPPGCGR